MAYLLTKDEFVQTIEALVAERPDFEYIPPADRGILDVDGDTIDGCVYAEPDEVTDQWVGSCALGQVVERIDGATFQTLVQHNIGAGWGTLFDDPDLFEFENDEDQAFISLFGDSFQVRQDRGWPWQRCLDDARRAVAGEITMSEGL